MRYIKMVGISNFNLFFLLLDDVFYIILAFCLLQVNCSNYRAIISTSARKFKYYC
jgi:hypothetical protein